MTVQFINVPKSLTSSMLKKTDHIQKEQESFLRTHRHELKAEILQERMTITHSRMNGLRHSRTVWGNVCAVCGEMGKELSMHEWLITRRHVMGVPFEWKMQIYVPWNCSLVHEGGCHMTAQTGQDGRLMCLRDALKYYSVTLISDWLMNIKDHIHIADEKLKWVVEYGVPIELASTSLLHS